eukprot:SAG11_NODE_51057_length_115_cov_162.000000_1_plen_38_part_11
MGERCTTCSQSMERTERSLDYLLYTNTDLYEEKATEYY